MKLVIFNNNRINLIYILMCGALAGLVFFLIHISNFFSYMSDDPKTCMNCHIMGPEYATWYHSSHREVTTCNDCHVPHTSFVAQYHFKAMDGLRHATIFTLRTEPQAIIIREAGRNAVLENCHRCHDPLFTEIEKSNSQFLHQQYSNTGRVCWDCHRETPHGTVRSLSSAPFARVPTTSSMVPPWLSKLMKNEKNLKEIKK